MPMNVSFNTIRWTVLQVSVLMPWDVMFRWDKKEIESDFDGDDDY